MPASLPADGRLRRLRLAAKWDREPMPVKLEALLVWELSKVAIPIDEDLNTDPATTTDTCEGDAEDADFLRFLLRRKITKGPGARAAGIAMAFKLGAAVLGLREGTQRCSPRPP